MKLVFCKLLLSTQQHCHYVDWKHFQSIIFCWHFEKLVYDPRQIVLLYAALLFDSRTLLYSIENDADSNRRTMVFLSASSTFPFSVADDKKDFCAFVRVHEPGAPLGRKPYIFTWFFSCYVHRMISTVTSHSRQQTTLITRTPYRSIYMLQHATMQVIASCQTCTSCTQSTPSTGNAFSSSTLLWHSCWNK